MLCFPPTNLLEPVWKRLQDLAQGGMEGVSLVGPLPSSHSLRDRLVPGVGVEGVAMGTLPPGPAEAHQWGCSPQGKGLCAGAPLSFTAFGPLG